MLVARGTANNKAGGGKNIVQFDTVKNGGVTIRQETKDGEVVDSAGGVQGHTIHGGVNIIRTEQED